MTDPRAALAEALAEAWNDAHNLILGPYSTEDAAIVIPRLAERGVLLVSKPGLRQLIRARVLPFVKDADAFADGIMAALPGEVTP